MQDKKTVFNWLADKAKVIGNINFNAPVKPNPDAFFNIGSTPLFTVSYDGEKNLGEIGPIKNYKLDYNALRLRSWQSYLESEITQTVLNKFIIWVVGAGLKLQADPKKKVLKSEGIEIDTEEFNELTESRFGVYSHSRCSDYAGMTNLHKIANTALINAIIGGDVLVINRYINNELKTQLIDGSHIQTPLIGSMDTATAKKNGNRIINGIELSPEGIHVAYYVQSEKDLLSFERIPARGEQSGKLMAYMVYGLRYRLDSHRGMPLIATVLETIKKLERYKEATVGSAEERQKIAFSIEHTRDSTGESVFNKQLAKAYDVDKNMKSDLPVDVAGKQMANTVASTTNKQTFNMPIGSSLKLLESKNELYFKDFYTTNINLICSAIGIPPEVALSKYDSNFSASRAALKDWEHTITVARKNFAFQFYQPFYNLWLETEILKNKIDAPGYLRAMIDKNNMVLDSYQHARFVGPGVPHIDPLKEVKAEREKLGELGKNLPLTTLEAATEALGGGESTSNMQQFSEERTKAEELGLKAEIVPPIDTNVGGTSN